MPTTARHRLRARRHSLRRFRPGYTFLVLGALWLLIELVA